MTRLGVLGGLILALLMTEASALMRPQLEEAANVAALKVSFVDSSLWNGEDIPRKMQCPRNGGVSPVSPELAVAGVPSGTQSLVVFFENYDADHNHGLIKFSGRARANGEYVIPSVAHGAESNLPENVSIFQGGTDTPASKGAAFWAPCPRRGRWQFKITVYAIDGNNVVLASSKIDWGIP